MASLTEKIKNKIKFIQIKKKVKKGLEKYGWSKLDCTYKIEEDSLEVSDSITLKNHDDSILFQMSVYAGGMVHIRFVFDRIEKNINTLNLVNDFNLSNGFFTATIRDDSYLELENIFAYYDNKVFLEYPSEALSRIADFSDDQILKKLTSLTYS